MKRRLLNTMEWSNYMINSFEGKFAFLSNFYELSTPIFDDMGIKYNTTEAFFQAQKTINQGMREVIADQNPSRAKRLGRAVKLRADWELIKDDVMKEALRRKFADPDLKAQLLATGEVELIEGNTWHDNYWGSCTCLQCGNRGTNKLGRLLMDLRDKLNA